MNLYLNDFSGGIATGLAVKNRRENTVGILKNLELDRKWGAAIRRQNLIKANFSTASPGTLSGEGIRTRLSDGTSLSTVTILKLSDNSLMIKVGEDTAAYTAQTAWDWSADPYDNAHNGLLRFFTVGNRIRAGNAAGLGFPVWFGKNLHSRFWKGSAYEQVNVTGTSPWLIGDMFDCRAPTDYITLKSLATNSTGGHMITGTYHYGVAAILDGYQETPIVDVGNIAVNGPIGEVVFWFYIKNTCPARLTGVTIYRKLESDGLWYAMDTFDATYGASYLDPPNPGAGHTPLFSSAQSQDWEMGNSGDWMAETTPQLVSLGVKDGISQSYCVVTEEDRKGYVGSNVISTYQGAIAIAGQVFCYTGQGTTGTKVYYNNVNGDGVSEHDIFPAINYLEFPNTVIGLEEDDGDLIVFTDSDIHRVALSFDAYGKIETTVQSSEQGQGLRGTRSLARLGGQIFFLGSDTFRSYDQQSGVEPIGTGIQDEVDGLTASSVRAAAKTDRQEYVVYTGSKLFVYSKTSWREVTGITPTGILPSVDGEVLIADTADLYKFASSGSENVSPTLKTNPLDFGVPDLLKKLTAISLVYQSSATVTVKLYKERSGTAAITLTFALQSGMATVRKLLPLGTYAREIEIEVTATNPTSFQIDAIGIEGEPVRKIGE